MAFRSVPRPSSPPGAKAYTECPSLARYYRSDLSKPQPCGQNFREDEIDRPNLSRGPEHTHRVQEPKTDGFQNTAGFVTQQYTRGTHRHHERQVPTTPLNVGASVKGQVISKDPPPGQTWIDRKRAQRRTRT